MFMFKLNEIKELIKLVDESSIQELEIENDDSRICIRKPSKAETIVVNSAVQEAGQVGTTAHINAQPQPTATAQAPATTSQNDSPAASEAKADNLHKITSPMVGTFYSAPAPDAPPFINIGDKVTEKSVVCIVEAMKLMNEIEAEVNGEIVEILVENGQLVEFGQPLFSVKI